jgi:hypothetical protein
MDDQLKNRLMATMYLPMATVISYGRSILTGQRMSCKTLKDGGISAFTGMAFCSTTATG